MKAIALSILFALAIYAAPQAAEIRGVVLEPGPNLPVAGATVALSVQTSDRVKLNGGWLPDERKATTDERGRFTLSLDKPGEYRVEARKEGYLNPGQDGPPNYAEVKLDADHPTADVKLSLVRPAALTGTAISDDTGKPLAGVSVRAVVKIRTGMLMPHSSAVITDSQGRFVIENLSPGDYAEVVPQTASAQRMRKKFTDADVKAFDTDYGHTFWPGGYGSDTAVPVGLFSGARFDVGTLRIRKAPFYRVHVRFPSGHCEAGEKISVSEVLIEGNSSSHYSLGSTACGQDILVTGYSPGTYRLMLAVEDRPPETRETASPLFAIVDKNLQLDVPLYRGVMVEGAFVVEGGSRLPDLTKTSVFLRGEDGAGSLEDRPVTPDSQGKFQIPNVRPLDQRVLVRGLSPANYLKQICYNGRLVSGTVVPLDPAAPRQSIAIVLGDDPGAVLGAVVSDEKPVDGAYVLAIEWPPSSDLSTTAPHAARSDAAGNFQLTGLPPGEYRVAAVRGVAMVSNAVILRALTDRGTKVDVAAGLAQNLKVEVIELK